MGLSVVHCLNSSTSLIVILENSFKIISGSSEIRTRDGLVKSANYFVVMPSPLDYVVMTGHISELSRTLDLYTAPHYAQELVLTTQTKRHKTLYRIPSPQLCFYTFTHGEMAKHFPEIFSSGIHQRLIMHRWPKEK